MQEHITGLGFPLKQVYYNDLATGSEMRDTLAHEIQSFEQEVMEKKVEKLVKDVRAKQEEIEHLECVKVSGKEERIYTEGVEGIDKGMSMPQNCSL